MRETKSRVGTVTLTVLLIGMLTLAFNIQQVKADWWSAPAQLTDNTVNDYYPYLSDDDGKIAFQSVVDGDSEIFVVNSDGSGLKQLTSNTASDHYHSISGDGGKIAFASDGDGDDEIFVVNSDGSGLKQLTSNTANDRSTSISGDGGKIAFTSDVDGDYEIFVVNSDGSGLTQLTSNTANEYYPHISGDGSKVAFYSDRDGDLEIFVVNSDGSGLKQLTFNTAGDWMPSISGDGGKVAFNSDIDGDSEIFVVNSDGSGLKQLTFNTANDYVSYDSISGDGGKIAFTSDVDGDYEIFVVNSDGSGLTQLTSNTADDYHHSISGDGGKVAFNSDIDGDYEIWVISAQAQLTIEVVGNGDTDPAAGSYLYDLGTMVLVDSQPEVGWMLDHWLLDGSDVSHDASYTITMDADHTLSAVFEAWAPPEASFTYSPSAPKEGETVSFDASASIDPDGIITSYAWDFGDTSTDSGETTTHAYEEAGTYAVTLTVTDNDGLADNATTNIHVDPPTPVDTTPPIGSVEINPGAATTDSVSVTLVLLAEDPESGVAEMRFSNDGSLWSNWEVYATSKAWTLTTGDGTKKVFVQFKNDAGLVSDTYSDTIILSTPSDTTPPMGAVAINGGAADTNSLSVTLTLEAADPESGVAEMRFSNDGSLWSNWEVYATSKAWTLTTGDGTKKVFVQFKNDAGLVSDTYSDTIALSTGKESSSISISMSATTFMVGESTTVSGSLSPPCEGASVTIQCRPSGGTWTTLEKVTTGSDGGYWCTWKPTAAGTYEVRASWEGDETTLSSESIGQPVTVKASSPAAFPLWVLAPIIGGITGITAVLVYFKRRKPKEEILKPAEPIITAEPTEIPAPAKKIEEEVLKPPEPIITAEPTEIPAPAKKIEEEVLKPAEEIPPQEVKEFPKLSAKCSDTIAMLNSFIEDPSRTNDRRAWKGFREFITITEQIEDEYAELIEIRNKLAVLRRKRNEYRSAGLDDLADKTEGVIQSNYGDSIRIIKEIREKLPQLGG